MTEKAAETGVRRGARPGHRLAWSAVPAAIVTAALFSAMTSAIAVEFVEPDDIASYDLIGITPQNRVEPVRIDDRPIIEPSNIQPPPRTSIRRVDPNEIKFDVSSFTGRVPELLDTEAIEMGPLDSSVFEDRLVEALVPLSITFPDRAARLGLSGTCDVRFGVDVEGSPFEVEAECSHPVFVKEAERAVGAASYFPQVENGQPVVIRNAIYPIQFELSD